MIQKNDGKINEIIYNLTVYNEGNSQLYVTYRQLKHLIKELLKANETTKYIRINPFYVNDKLNLQAEYDEYMFYMECRSDFTTDDLKAHWSSCMDHIYDIPHKVKQYDDMNEEEQRKARTLYPICNFNDVENYRVHLIDFVKYLDELLPVLLEDVAERGDISYGDLAFGYFCFEIHSG